MLVMILNFCFIVSSFFVLHSSFMLLHDYSKEPYFLSVQRFHAVRQFGVEIQTGNLEAEEEDYEILINIFRDKVKEKFILASQLSEF